MTTQQRIERIKRRAKEDFSNGISLETVLSEALTAFAEEQEKWKPISSAPKDGTWVILATSEGIQCGYWGASWADSSSWIKYHHRSDQEPVLGRITHWQPLPPAPSTGEKPE